MTTGKLNEDLQSQIVDLQYVGLGSAGADAACEPRATRRAIVPSYVKERPPSLLRSYGGTCLAEAREASEGGQLNILQRQFSAAHACAKKKKKRSSLTAD